jgi:molybdenum cofactor cytidylyltransferase
MLMGWLLDKLSVSPGDCVAVVGAGGKTSLCWLLMQEFVRRSESVVFTTTTKIRQPRSGLFAGIFVNPNITNAIHALRINHSIGTPFVSCVASAFDGPRDETPVHDSLMPVFHTKLVGFTADEMCQLRQAVLDLEPRLSLIVEADGARGLLIKAPANYEPVIPPCASVVCVVANLQALGQPLDERVAHRAERIATLTGMSIGQPATAQLLVNLLAHPEGGLKGIPPAARRVAVLMQRDEATPHPDAAQVANALVRRGYDRAIVIAPRAQRVYPLIFANQRE